jgi:fatty acid desaturase
LRKEEDGAERKERTVSTRQNLPFTDAELRRLIRADLPPEAFKNHPWRCLLGVPLGFGILAISVLIVVCRPPWYVALAGSVVLGALYASLFNFGHEVGHDAVIRIRWMQTAIIKPFTVGSALKAHLRFRPRVFLRFSK